MKVNKLNYENYVIDYIEGTLQLGQKKEFDLFLSSHPEVYDEIKDYISAPILAEDTAEVFTDKDALLQKSTTTISKKYILALGAFLLLATLIYQVTQFGEITDQDVKYEIKTQSIMPMAETTPKMIEKEPSTLIKKQEEVKAEVAFTEVKKEKTIPTVQKTAKENIQLAAVKIVKESQPEEVPAVRRVEVKDNEMQELNTAMALIDPMTQLNQIASNLEIKERSKNAMSINIALIDKDNSTYGSKNKKEKSQWMKMITPASFEDVNIVEALTINTKINELDGILESFVPNALTK